MYNTGAYLSNAPDRTYRVRSENLAASTRARNRHRNHDGNALWGELWQGTLNNIAQFLLHVFEPIFQQHEPRDLSTMIHRLSIEARVAWKRKNVECATRLRCDFALGDRVNHDAHSLMQGNRSLRRAAMMTHEPEHSGFEPKHVRAIRTRCEMRSNLMLLHFRKFTVEIGVQFF